MTGDPTATGIPVLGMPETQARPGVTSYPASYFDSAQPSSAKDMIDRLPGFTFDAGSDTRGFVDSVGNVLIDGTRPASKTDGIENQLQRIPAAQVERIDVIRGGASGIDMKGKSVVADVIRKTTCWYFDNGTTRILARYLIDRHTVMYARARGWLAPGI